MAMQKVAIITGGAKGIGRAIALKFAENGVNVVINYLSSDPAQLVAQIEKMGVQALAVKADVSDFEQAQSLINAAMEKFGRIDYLINNAGITRDGLILKMKEADFDAVIDANLKGTFNTIRHTSNIMLKQKGGAIVNIASVAGIIGNAGQANYSAAKAGIIAMTKTVARELGSRGITVNAVAPGFIETDMTDVLPEAVKAKLLDSIALRRYGKPEEVADLVYFVANCSYMTAQCVTIDGGMI
ncbi:MAG: 3-oxoacyl-[acyl-carrier-protein] reductase [Defluviitaleaceae bacterium]|nr:3-oxoacyl-[acyl-carrier-protein] reductase [Defluviitaleaceae bacterium]